MRIKPNPTLYRSLSLDRATKTARSEASKALLKVVARFVQIGERRLAGDCGISSRPLIQNSAHHDPSRPNMSDFYIDIIKAVRAVCDPDEEREFYAWCKNPVVDGERQYYDPRPWTKIGTELIRRNLVDDYFKPIKAHEPAKQRGASTASIKCRYDALRLKDDEWRRLRDAALVLVHTEDTVPVHLSESTVKLEPVGFDIPMLLALFCASSLLRPLYGHRYARAVQV